MSSKLTFSDYNDFILLLIFIISSHVFFCSFSFFDSHFWKKGSSWDGIGMKKIESVWAGIKKVDAAYEFKARNEVFFFEGKRICI